MRNVLNLIVIGSLLMVCTAAYGRTNLNTQSFGQSQISDVSAVSKGGGTLVRWQVQDGRKIVGFFVYRAIGKAFVRVSDSMISGANVAHFVFDDQEFSYFDREGNLGDTYKIEVIEVGMPPSFSKSTQAIYSVDFNEPANSTGSGGSNGLLIKNEPKEFVESESLSDVTTQRWVAAQPGAKINIKQAGFVRVTRTELQNAGFDVNAPENTWQLYLEGIEQAIKIGSGGSYIEFYGTGVDELETDKNVYYLVVGSGNGKRIQPKFLRQIGPVVQSRNFPTEYIRKVRSNYLSRLLNGPQDNYIGELISSTNTTINFDLTGISEFPSPVELSIEIQGWTPQAHSVQLKLNGIQISPSNGNSQQRWVSTYSLKSNFFVETGNTLELQSLLGSSDLSFLGSVKAEYKRAYKVYSQRLAFSSENYRRTTVTGVTDNQVRFFDMSVPGEPAEVTNAVVSPAAGGGFEAVLPAVRGRKMYALESGGILTPSSVVANTPSSLSIPGNGTNFLVITNPAFMAEANQWAAYRAGDGLQSMVVDVNDVFDEFGFGRVSANSISSFLEYAHTNWTTKPTYVLLLGDSTYDPRNYEGHGEFNFMPVKLVDTLYEETGSDDALTDFDDDGLAEIPIGRIPARTGVAVTNALQKVTTFESTVSNAQLRGSLCASDLPNGYDFEALCNRLHDELPASIPRSTVNRGVPDAKNVLLAEMNGGKYIVNYSGHGSTGVWAHTSFFGINDVASLNNQSNLSIYMMLTCLNGYFIRPNDDGLSERLLSSTFGGGSVVWSSAGSTTPDVQEVMAKRFFNRLTNGTMTRMGNLVNDAKSNVVGGRDVRLSWILLGDPAMKIKPPVTTFSEVKAGS